MPYTIKGGFQIKNGKMTEESARKFEEVMGGSIGGKLGLKKISKEEAERLRSPKKEEKKKLVKKKLVKKKAVKKKSRKRKKK